MKEIDKLYTKYPFYDSRRLTVNLADEFQQVNVKRVVRLMKLMNIEAICPKPNLLTPDLQHKIYPYLLREKKINKVNQVWSTDIFIEKHYHFNKLTILFNYWSTP